MNLQQFIDYKKICPICKRQLYLSFHSAKKQSVKMEDDRIVFIFPMKSLYFSKIEYYIGYSFSYIDYSFQIEFYSPTMERYDDAIPISMLKKFQVYFKHTLGRYVFIKKCINCPGEYLGIEVGYEYASDFIKLDFKNNSMSEIVIDVESLNFESENVLYCLTNSILYNNSVISLLNIIVNLPAVNGNFKMTSHKENNSIELTSYINIPDDLSLLKDRIKKLLIFS